MASSFPEPGCQGQKKGAEGRRGAEEKDQVFGGAVAMAVSDQVVLCESFDLWELPGPRVAAGDESRYPHVSRGRWEVSMRSRVCGDFANCLPLSTCVTTVTAKR